MYIIIIFASAIVIFISLIFFKIISKGGARKIKEAMRLETAGKYHEALAIYDYLLKKGYSSLELRWKIANTSMKVNLISRAQKELLVLIETKNLPENVSIFAVKKLMVECYLKLGRIKAAFIELIEISKVEADNPFVLFELAKIYAGQKITRKAIELFEKCLKQNPNDPEINYYLARAYLDVGDSGKATKYLDRVARMRYYDRGKVNYYLGVLYFSQKKYSIALQHFTDVLKQSPGDNKILSESYHLLALCYKERGLIDEAITNFEKSQTYSQMLSENTQGKKILYNQGVLLYKNGQYKKALEKFYKLKMIDYRYKDVDKIIKTIASRMRSGEKMNVNIANYINDNPLVNILKRGLLYSSIKFNINVIELESEKYSKGSTSGANRLSSYITINKFNSMASRDFKELARKIVKVIGYQMKSEPKFYGDYEYIDGNAINFYVLPLKHLNMKTQILMTVRRYKEDVHELSVSRFLDRLDEKGTNNGIFIASGIFSVQALKVIQMYPHVKFIDKTGLAKILGRIR